jgi:regulator of sigma E protease
MEPFLTRAAQLILSLSILILVHELGHFLFARKFKVRVDKFYMFFNPLFSLVRLKKIDGKFHFSWFSKQAPAAFQDKPDVTEFGLGWIPLGGYCSISGMVDESLNMDQMAQAAQPWEFRTKKAGQRLLIMAGGVLFNFVLALIIYSAVLNVWGETYVPLRSATMGMEFAPVAQEAGFRDGDILMEADGVALDRFDEHSIRQVLEAKQVKVLRGGSESVVTLPAHFMTKLIESGQGFASFRYPTIVKEVNDGTPSAKANLMPGDSLVAVNGRYTESFPLFVEALSKFKGQTIDLSFYRLGTEKHVRITPDENGKLGFMAKSPNELLPTKVREYTFFQSIPAGITKGFTTLTGYASDMKYAFTKAGAKSLGGFGTLGKLFPAEMDWEVFWLTTAFLSIILAFMNILPIPALDGGHILFLLYEIIFRRRPSDKFMQYAQMTGMFLLFALLVYANGNDLYRWLFR